MKKVKVCIVFLLALMLIMSVAVFAEGTLNINVTASNKTPEVDDEITASVNFGMALQAADYTLNYDSSILEFLGSSLSDSFYNASTPGTIRVSWFDASNEVSNMTFRFKVIAEGDANLSVTPDRFATSDLEEPDVGATTPVVINAQPSAATNPTPTPTATPIPGTPATSVPASNKTAVPIQVEGNDNSLSAEVIPYAGSEMKVVFALAGCVLLIGVFGVALYKMRDIK